jgi:hypothetical protein
MNFFDENKITCVIIISVEFQEQLRIFAKSDELSLKLWEVIMLLPTNPLYYKLVQTSADRQLCQLAESLADSNESPYMLLYHLQIVEILHSNRQLCAWPGAWPEQVHRLVQTLVASLRQSASRVLLDCLLVAVRLMFGFLCVEGKTGGKCESVGEGGEDLEGSDADGEASDVDETPRKKVKRCGASGGEAELRNEGKEIWLCIFIQPFLSLLVTFLFKS